MVSYGIAGFGGIAENRLAKEGFGLGGASASREAALVVATDVNPSRRAAAEALGCSWCGDFDQLLARPDVDAICVATNNLSHFELARRALLAGKHVFVEKPLASRAEDARALSALARERSLSLCVDHMMTKNGYNLEARRLALGGEVGKLASICVHMEFSYGATPEEAATWRCSRPEELGGPLGDVGSHCLYMAEFLAGERIARIGCSYYPRSLSINVENGAIIQFAMRSGLEGSARVAFNQARGSLSGTIRGLGFEIYGEEGVIRSYGTMFQLSGSGSESCHIGLELEREGIRREIEASSPPNVYRAQLEAHARSISEGRPLDGSEGAWNLELVEACHESARRGGAMLELPL